MSLIKEVHYKGQKMKKDVIYLTSKGAFQLVETKLLTYVDEIKNYVSEEEVLEKHLIQCKINKVPFKVINLVWNFLRVIYDKTKTEVAVMLWYNPIKDDWKVEVPEQVCSGASVNYDRSTPEARKLNKKLVTAGYILAGTIHSHAGMTAFHSGTDDKDELQFDGLHMTMGNFNLKAQSFSQRLITGTMITTLDFFEMVKSENIKTYWSICDVPEAWVDAVKITKPTPIKAIDFDKIPLKGKERFMSRKQGGLQSKLKATPLESTFKKISKGFRHSKQERRRYKGCFDDSTSMMKCPTCANLTPLGIKACSQCGALFADKQDNLWKEDEAEYLKKQMYGSDYPNDEAIEKIESTYKGEEYFI